MEYFKNNQARIAANMQLTYGTRLTKSQEDDIEKARSGVYANTAENRKLGRVGQKYGAKSEPGESPKKSRKEQERKVAGLVANPPENFFEQVERHFGLPDDDGESEAALIKRIMSHSSDKVNSFLSSLEAKQAKEENSPNSVKPSDVAELFEKFDDVFTGEEEGIDDFVNDLYDDFDLEASSEEPDELLRELKGLGKKKLQKLHNILSEKIKEKEGLVKGQVEDLAKEYRNWLQGQPNEDNVKEFFDNYHQELLGKSDLIRSVYKAACAIKKAEALEELGI